MKPKEPTLVKYYPHLLAKDKALVMRALNEQRQEGQGEIHLGILPFVSMSRVATALKATQDANLSHRIWADLCTKLEVRRWLDEPKVKKVYLDLNPAKVAKRLGMRPHLGVTIPVIPKVRTRGGLVWSVAHCDWIPEKILAAPRITLTPQKGAVALFELAAPREYFDLAHAWLIDNCE